MAYKVRRQTANEERDQKIALMDINELKDFLCMKSNRNPETCKNCVSSKSCTAGQRAIVLLNEAENERAKPAPTSRRNSSKVKEARERFAAVCQQDDMVQYVMDRDGCNRDRAVISINGWKSKYPDIAEKYNFKERYAKQLGERAKFRSVSKPDAIAEEMEEESRRQFEAALQQGDMVRHVMDTFEVDRQRARSKLRYWKGKYPEMAEQYGFDSKFGANTMTPEEHQQKQRDEAISRYMEARAENDPIAYIMDKYGIEESAARSKYKKWESDYGNTSESKEKQMTETSAEEMSIEDFLKDSGGVEQTVKAEEIAEAMTAQEEIIKAEPTDGFRKELDAKYEELGQEKKRLYERLSWIEKAQEALVMTMNLFNPESIIGRDLTGKGA